MGGKRSLFAPDALHGCAFSPDERDNGPPLSMMLDDGLKLPPAGSR